MKKIFTLEICVDSVQSAINAQAGGADRVEFCANMYEGGTSPSYGAIAMARKYLDIELSVMIRPRGGDFDYNDIEFEQMKSEILEYKSLGVDGFVFGILDRDGKIDTVRVKELVNLAKPAKVTFHRAFDLCKNPFIALNDLICLGVDRLLTSGQQARAIDGAKLIKDLIAIANNEIIIMPGSGINADNIKDLQTKTGAKEFHMTANKQITSMMRYQKQKVPMGGKLKYSDFAMNETDPEKVREIFFVLG
ncbi:MAG: copper homeostasis protein CutC [Candidatus Cloacimonadales bacterium]|jgi:copper homeostasis protein|nr:copper homeostasis protein CutC [Candidatus Cloacimonadota bacterium]MDX9977401.1 copper homeostasis protein CutC [Candidatus Cloacimonadales bacterium]